jgi:protein-L-isoaspartate(D-aspartate) O-methyltransferase
MNTEFARQQMIEQQVRAWEVLDPRVLEAMARVPRERFVPEAFRAAAFADTFVPLPCGQSMLKPALEGRILQAIDVQPGERVLEFGTGSGFFAACMAAMGGTVRTVDIHPELTAFAQSNLRGTGYGAVTAVTADATAWSERETFDVVVLTASLPEYDDRWQRLLTIGRGRLFAVVGQGPAMEATLVVRSGERQFARTGLFETAIDPLEHAKRPSPFVF